MRSDAARFTGVAAHTYALTHLLRVAARCFSDASHPAKQHLRRREGSQQRGALSAASQLLGLGFRRLQAIQQGSARAKPPARPRPPPPPAHAALPTVAAAPPRRSTRPATWQQTASTRLANAQRGRRRRQTVGGPAAAARRTARHQRAHSGSGQAASPAHPSPARSASDAHARASPHCNGAARVQRDPCSCCHARKRAQAWPTAVYRR